MQIYPILRGFLKIFLFILSISVLLTSFIGGISIFRLIGTPDNFTVDQEGIDMSFGASGNHFLIEMDLNNSGYFAFEDFTITIECIFQNKTNLANFTILNKTLFNQKLEGRTAYHITLEANNSDFTPNNLLSDNLNSWFDPEIQSYIDNGTITEIEAFPSSFPYLLWNYDIIYNLKISSYYNIGLLEVGLNVELLIDYYQFFTEDYPDLKAAILAP